MRLKAEVKMTVALTLLAVVAVTAALVVVPVGQAEEQPPQPVDQYPGKCTASQHKKMIAGYRVNTGSASGKVVFGEKHYIPKRARVRHGNIVGCAQSRATEKAMVRNWRSAKREHSRFERAVLAFPGGSNPIGGNRWGLPYHIVVCESGAGSGSWNLYGMLQGWAYAPPFAPGSVYDATFWEQSIAAYNLRQLGYGGWSCA